jgi:hypothetical protein
LKRTIVLVCLFLVALPAWSAKTITVVQLAEMMHQMQTEKKTDAEIASALKQVELSEELTLGTMNALIKSAPGPMVTEQIYVLEAKAATLPAPALDQPSTPAPDAALQTEILARVARYASTSYAQLPRLTATKITARFQDNVEAVPTTSGMSFSAKGVSVGSLLVTANRFVHFIRSSASRVVSQGGAEILPKTKDKTPWGANGLIALEGQPPVLSNVLKEAQESGQLTFLRWETVAGKTTAVFRYAVDRKQTHYAVNYCCFPDVEQIGTARFGNAGQTMTAAGSGVNAGGNVQTLANWKPWKDTVPYHGELFVDPETGIVLRLILEADFKTSDVVHQEDNRIDYGPVTVGGKPLVVPLRSIVVTEIVQNGDSQAGGGYNTRHVLLTSEYKGYAPAL